MLLNDPEADVLLDAATKGIPVAAAPLRLREVAAQGWNVLAGDCPLPLAVIRTDIMAANSAAMARKINTGRYACVRGFDASSWQTSQWVDRSMPVLQPSRPMLTSSSTYSPILSRVWPSSHVQRALQARRHCGYSWKSARRVHVPDVATFPAHWP